MSPQMPPYVADESPRDMWYGISYECVGHVHKSASTVEQIALAAIMNFQGMVAAYCSSPADGKYREGHRFATHFIGVKSHPTERGENFTFQVYNPMYGFEWLGTVVIHFRWNHVTGADKIVRTEGFTAHAKVYGPNNKLPV